MHILKHTLMLAIAAFTLKTAHAQQTVDTTKTWTIKGENTFLLNQSSFSNWAAGGVNSLAGNLLFNYDFNYKKEKWNWDNKVIAAFGQTRQKETGWRKNDDRLVLNSLLGYQAKENWLYTFYMNFNTQFTDGFNYATQPKTRISTFLAPAYLSFGPGFAYKKSDNFRVNISPAAARFVIVKDQALRSNYGVDVDKSNRFEFGASLDAYYKTDIMENVSFENILKLYSNYLEKPQNVDVDYTANLNMKVNRFITVNAGVQLLYDNNTLIPREDGSGARPTLQVKQILGAGITYKF